MSAPPKSEFRARRWAAARERLGKTIIWTVIGAGLLVVGCVWVVADRGTTWMVSTGVVALFVGLLIAMAIAWQAAGKRASSGMIRDWAAANGWAYWGRDMPAAPTPEPFESRYDDSMLATESFPEATPLLRKGNRRYVTDVLAGTVDGLPVRIANHTYETDSYDGHGNRTTTYTNHVVALVPQAPKVTPLRVVRRSRMGKALKGADDTLAGIGGMKAVDVENRDFNTAFSLRVADDADMVLVFQLFDQVTQERLADGRDIPTIDLVEAEGPWLMLADGGTVRGDQLTRIEQMIAAIRWARTTLD
jgi:hypothetical protein